eukprot:185829_1
MLQINYLASMQGKRYNIINQDINKPSSPLFHSDKSSFKLNTKTDSILQKVETAFLNEHGYQKDKQLINSTVQPELFLAKTTNKQYVSISKISKQIFNTLNTTKTIINSHAEFFQSEKHYYLVDNIITLKAFVIKAHKYIQQNRLQLRTYKHCIKHILWQLANTLHHLHNSNKCHLGICPENILLINSEFIQTENDTVSINPNVTMGLINAQIALSETDQSHNTIFKYNKQFLPSDSTQYICPDILKGSTQYYDALSSDIWAYGMTMYYSFIGDHPYTIQSEKRDTKTGSGYWAMKYGELQQYIRMDNKGQFVNRKIISLLNETLQFDSKNRCNAHVVLTHKLFSRF